MKKKDLKTGMVVKLKNGKVYEVMLDRMDNFNPNILRRSVGWIGLCDYTDNLLDIDNVRNSNWHIMEIYNPIAPRVNLEDFPEGHELIWKRD